MTLAALRRFRSDEALPTLAISNAVAVTKLLMLDNRCCVKPDQVLREITALMQIHGLQFVFEPFTKPAQYARTVKPTTRTVRITAASTRGYSAIAKSVQPERQRLLWRSSKPCDTSEVPCCDVEMKSTTPACKLGCTVTIFNSLWP